MPISRARATHSAYTAASCLVVIIGQNDLWIPPTA
jgi:hypothetical protein